MSVAASGEDAMTDRTDTASGEVTWKQKLPSVGETAANSAVPAAVKQRKEGLRQRRNQEIYTCKRWIIHICPSIHLLT